MKVCEGEKFNSRESGVESLRFEAKCKKAGA
jgi:hypothetical protein